MTVKRRNNRLRDAFSRAKVLAKWLCFGGHRHL